MIVTKMLATKMIPTHIVATIRSDNNNIDKDINSTVNKGKRKPIFTNYYMK